MHISYERHDELAAIDVSSLEQMLSGMEDVRAVRIVPTAEGAAIDEIHVLAEGEKSPKQLVRDIESAIMAQHGVAVDRRKISIAQLGLDKVSREALRPKIGSVVVDIADSRATVYVSLEMHGETYRGSAAGVASQTGRLRLVSLATIDALERLTNGSLALTLEDVAFIKMVGRKIALVCLAIVHPGGEQIYCGSAVVGESYKDAIVRATLDAVNRRLALA